MSYTPSELIAALDRHDVSVNKRKLTDWSQKGLLPPLKRIGLGQGKGTRWFWENDDVLQQAIAAEYFLSRKYRTRYALCRLWLAGFNVPVELGRATWLEHIELRTEFIDREANKNPGGLAGYLSFFQEKIIKRLSKKDEDHTFTNFFNEKTMEFLELIYDENSKSDDWDAAKSIREAFNLQLDRKGRVDLRLAARFFYTGIKSLSLDSLARTIATTGNAELEKCNIAVNGIRSVVTRYLVLGLNGKYFYGSVGAASLINSDIAPILILTHLKFQKMGLEYLLDNSIETAVNALNKLSNSDINLTDKNQLLLSDYGKHVWDSAKVDLEKLWSDFGGDAGQWNTDSAKPLKPN